MSRGAGDRVEGGLCRPRRMPVGPYRVGAGAVCPHGRNCRSARWPSDRITKGGRSVRHHPEARAVGRRGRHGPDGHRPGRPSSVRRWRSTRRPWPTSTPTGSMVGTPSSTPATRPARKGRLMAFGATGYLPDNIVAGGVATVAALQSSVGAVNEADNPVHWNQLQGVPDAVLRADTTRSLILFETPPIAPGGQGLVSVTYPVGLDVDPTLDPDRSDRVLLRGHRGWPAWLRHPQVRRWDRTEEVFVVQNIGAVASTVKVRATVWNEAYLSPSAVKDKVGVSFYREDPGGCTGHEQGDLHGPSEEDRRAASRVGPRPRTRSSLDKLAARDARPCARWR